MKLKESDVYIKKNIVIWQYDAWKMKDLYYLTAFVGPFTTTGEIDTFMTSATETKKKKISISMKKWDMLIKPACLWSTAYQSFDLEWVIKA